MKRIASILLAAAVAVFCALPLSRAQTYQLATSAGFTAYSKSNLAASAQLVAAAASGAKVNLYGYNISNGTSATIYIQFFDAATAGAVTVGTTVPRFWIAVPANGVTDAAFGPGLVFTSGIVIAATTTPTGSAAPNPTIPTVVFYAN